MAADGAAAMSEREQRLLIVRFAIYSGAMLALLLLLPRLIMAPGTYDTTEEWPLEIIQLSVLAATILLFGINAIASPAGRGLMWIFTALTTLALIRELDAFLDAQIPWGGWKLAAIAALVAYGIPTWISRCSIAAGIDRTLASRAFPLLWIGTLCVVLIAQLIGHGPTVRVFLGDGDQEVVKRFIEEALETVGYLLLFFGAIELSVRSGSTRCR